jgi:hypothetical protein
MASMIYEVKRTRMVSETFRVEADSEEEAENIVAELDECLVHKNDDVELIALSTHASVTDYITSPYCCDAGPVGHYGRHWKEE